jgi:hypothetical protein
MAEIFFSQVCHRDVAMAIASFKLLEKSWQQPWRLNLIEDGTVNSRDWEQLRSAFPTAVFFPKHDVKEKIEQLLAKHPACLAFYRTDFLGSKLFEPPLLSASTCHYCDTDIIFFRRFERLWPSSSEVIFLCENYGFDGYSHSLFDWAIRHRIPLAQNINSGMYRIPSGFHDLDKIEWFLERTKNPQDRFLVEQECWAFLAASVPHRLVAPSAILCTKYGPLPHEDFPPGIHFLGFQKEHFWKFIPMAETAMEREPISELWTIEGQRMPWDRIAVQIVKRAQQRLVSSMLPKKHAA